MYEVGPVNFVHGLEIGEVDQKNGCLHDVFKGQAFGFQNSCDVVENALCLRLDAAGNDLAALGIERDLSGAVNCRSNADGLRVRPDGCGCVGSGDDFLHALDCSCKSTSHNVHKGHNAEGMAVILSEAKDLTDLSVITQVSSVIKHRLGDPSRPFGMTDQESQRY